MGRAGAGANAKIMVMHKNAKRPVYLNLLQIRLPIGGVISIIHRISGAVLALFLPFALCALQASLESPERFAQVQAVFASTPGRAALLLALWLLVQHLYSGLRHLLIDIDVGVELPPCAAIVELREYEAVVVGNSPRRPPQRLADRQAVYPGCSVARHRSLR